jgi:hypothetical protein
MSRLLLAFLFLPACGGAPFTELAEQPDTGGGAQDVAPDRVGDPPMPDAGDASPSPEVSPEADPPDAPPDVTRDAGSEAASPPPDAAATDAPSLAACSYGYPCRAPTVCQTETQYCVVNPSNTLPGTCVNFPPQCNTCDLHTCACIALYDSAHYADYTACADGSGMTVSAWDTEGP